MIKVGKFKIEVSEPWPVFIKIKYRNSHSPETELESFRHDELSDLLYAVRKAIVETESLLLASSGADREKVIIKTSHLDMVSKTCGDNHKPCCTTYLSKGKYCNCGQLKNKEVEAKPRTQSVR